MWENGVLCCYTMGEPYHFSTYSEKNSHNYLFSFSFSFFYFFDRCNKKLIILKYFTGRLTTMSIVITGEFFIGHLKICNKLFICCLDSRICLTCSFHLGVISFGTSGLCILLCLSLWQNRRRKSSKDSKVFGVLQSSQAHKVLI